MNPPFRSILCPSDLSATGDRAVSLAYALAGQDSIVHLLHVWEPAYVLSPLDATPIAAIPWTPEQDAGHEKRVHSHFRSLVPTSTPAHGCRTEIHVLKAGDAGVAIRAEATRLHADLVVMGTRGRGGVARALMGSVAMDVLKHAGVPVVLVHDPAAKS
jgi:nucleotide-binding universal stress UspA family protein